MKKYYAVILGVFCFAVLTCAYSLVSAEPKTESPECSGKIENGIRVVNIKSSKYKYEPDPVVVKLGEKVRIIATSSDVAHGVTIGEFNVNLVIEPGETETAEFTADKEGEFIIYCTVYCGPGHTQMRGKLMVKK